MRLCDDCQRAFEAQLRSRFRRGGKLHEVVRSLAKQLLPVVRRVAREEAMRADWSDTPEA